MAEGYSDCPGGDNRGISGAGDTEEPPPGAAGRPGALARAADWLVPKHNPSDAIYGVILIGALLAAESGRHETYLETFSSAALAAALYWLAHAYAGLLGRRLIRGERIAPLVLARALARDWALIRGAAVPLLALLLAALAGADQETAVTAALWSAVASLVLLELIAGLRSGAARGELVIEVAVGLTMGLAILALKVILH
ncbi:MAG: hypothetical protein ACYDC2_04890 [Solirubrobacteraceae bacterium]